MKKAAIRLFAVMLAVTIVLGTACAFADGGWDCAACGQSGNTGNFCSNCGAARPAADWTCPNCGQKGNTGKFCSNCGAAKPASGGQAVSEWLEQIPGETGRVKVILQGEYSKKARNVGSMIAFGIREDPE